MAEITVEIMREIAEELQGTCGTLDAALEVHGIDIDSVPVKLLQEIDEITIECPDCGWWCESSEMNEEGVCKDCSEDEP
jgi:hypothetical protein